MYCATCIHILAAGVAVAAYAADVPPSQSLAVETNETAYVLTVPVSGLTLTIPKGGLVLKSNAIGGATDNPRYFYFEDPLLNLIVSGWFEPAHGFSGVEEFWRAETAAWKKRDLPEPRNVVFEKIGKWDTIIYELKMPHGGTNSHVRGHWVQAGTWIDIHFSLTSDKTSEQNRKQLRSILEALVVKEKTGE
jgi:hypothetical protein